MSIGVVISQDSLADQVHNQLISALVDGAFTAGDRLVMDRLAETFGVSRTPVRDALARLERDGLVTPATRGYVVRTVTEADVAAIFDARLAIEGHTVALVAEAGPAAVAQVEAAIDAVAASTIDGPSDAFWANRSIHRAIADAAGNPILLQCFDSVWNSSVAAFAFGQMHRSVDDHADIAEQHRPLLRALASGDPERARDAMARHLADGQNHIGY